ncbi:MAG: leucyl aminopeptidase [Alphaproteobacteria bacterium]|nr:leucyl aminopeptidase [Alphaproteobacteria bacterium]
MTSPAQIEFHQFEPDKIAAIEGKISILVDGDGAMDAMARKINTLTKGAVKRLAAGADFVKSSEGSGHVLAFPAGLSASAVQVIKISRRPNIQTARKAGAAMAKFQGASKLTVLAAGNPKAAEISFGLSLRGYSFKQHKTSENELAGSVNFIVNKPEVVAQAATPLTAVAEGIFFTRDLVNEPANILTTTDFAARLVAMKKLDLEVTVLNEAELEGLGMRALLGVGIGSETPTKVVVMEWKGGGDEAPFALVGKGVVFDTGGISLKPGAGMEDMTMDMGGAGVVSGVMRTLALRGAKANVVGVVGLVENMPDGRAQRPGDVVTSMKGDTIEVINTDAEGRLVLADILWYTQERFNPCGMINLATLTGAIIIGLGHENAGVFSNDDNLCAAFLKSAEAEGEGAWRMPLGKAYDDLIKSRIADMQNVGGRAAGSITAAQFLQRFVKEDTPWIHLDIAGVALLKTNSVLAPKGATGWGVMALNRLIADEYER